MDLEAMGRDAAALVVSHPQFRGIAGHIWELMAEVKRLEAEIDRPKHEVLRQLADLQERYAYLKAEVERLRKIVDLQRAALDVWKKAYPNADPMKLAALTGGRE